MQRKPEKSFVDHKQTWKERTIRKSLYLGPQALKDQLINFADYKMSCERNEMPSRFRKVGISHTNLETLQKSRYEREQSPNEISMALPEKQTSPLMRNKSHKSMYTVDKDEIRSVEQFFQVYKEVKARQKKFDKVINKQKVDQRRRRVDDIHNSSLKSFVAARGSPGPTGYGNQYSEPVENNQQARPSVIKVADFLEGAVIKVSRAVTPSNTYSHPFLRTQTNVQEDGGSPLNQTNKRLETGDSREESIEIESSKGMTEQQRFTEKVIDKHFMSMTVSPKLSRQHMSSAQKERNYYVLFKDPKVMDQAVENSIQRVYKMVKKRIGNELYTGNSQCNTGVAASLESLADERKIMDSRTQIDLSQSNSKEASKRITREIEKNIKLIDNILNAGMSKPQTPSRLLSSPQAQAKSPTDIMRVKNRFPLRSTIAQKYNLREKITDHKESAVRLREVSTSYEKIMKANSFANQTYLTSY